MVGKANSWGAIPAGVACVRPVFVLVTPPDETDPLTARWPYGPVCGGRIAGSAYGESVTRVDIGVSRCPEVVACT